MSNQKAYFLLPSTDIRPDTLIHLGQIVLSLKEPHRPVTSDLHPPPFTTYKTIKTGYELTTSNTASASMGLGAKFLAQLGSSLSGGLSISKQKSSTTHWRFHALETYSFELSQTYINTLLTHSATKHALTKSKCAALYIISGLKIARGASYTRSETNTRGTTLDVSVDVTGVTGVPVSFGPELKASAFTIEKESVAACEDFVWAARYRKIRVSFWSRNKVIGKDVFGGELVSRDGNGEEGDAEGFSDEEDEEVDVEVEEAELEEGDVGVGFTPRGWRKEGGRDEDGVECVVVW